MATIGDTLRDVRQARKISLEDASRSTKIKLEILERLESDEFDRLASPAYVRGFLKLYAEYLGLESQPLIDAYLESQGGLRRHGLQLETEAAARARQPGELQLPLRHVVVVVVGLTALVAVTLLGRALLTRLPSQADAVAPPVPTASGSVSRASFDAWYQPKNLPAPALIEVPSRE